MFKVRVFVQQRAIDCSVNEVVPAPHLQRVDRRRVAHDSQRPTGVADIWQ